ncbi:FlgB family protein [Alloyangia pacifica]|uniref:Flagellar basal-body rod protein FlgB n=1 Tax=Alloyangia pacifica TaxID=311180 RepID=A0A1I6U0L0_9RHOB|nr:FlgB family protein [Alloyangia pacifica]SDH31972.1 flagellar basal-body rod protein FlgB [Alloyangia pacifica]SFS94888.1 flagellar basal-body rod protein FlgB [Alloyangia pacifica]
MFQTLDVFRTAMAMARHAGAAQAASAQNIANADTPGYRGVDLPDFTDTLDQTGGAMRVTRAGHLGGHLGARSLSAQPPEFVERRGTEDPNGNTVSIEVEMLGAVDAQRAHERALSIYRSNLTLLRASLGT